MSRPLDRRAFLGAGLALAAGPALLARARPAPQLKKAVKFGMIRIRGSIEDKFNLIKKLGFQGVELDSPSKIDRDEAVRARDKSGIVIHGVVDSIHWNVRLSDPDPEVRAKGLAGLKTALEDCKFYGGDTALLVPGKVADKEKENYEQVWERSTAEVRKAPSRWSGTTSSPSRSNWSSTSISSRARTWGRTSIAATWSATASSRGTGSASWASGW
jgi:L-ribulose-5-phosphate 3-epimerase